MPLNSYGSIQKFFGKRFLKLYFKFISVEENLVFAFGV